MSIKLLIPILLLATLQAQDLTPRERQLLDRIAKLEERLNAIESRMAPVAAAPTPVAAVAPPVVAEAQPTPRDTTINFYFDGYYGWNGNRPIGRANLLRAYDVTANNFSINQAGAVIEKAANNEAGKRWGYRLDLMFGQATETLQGSPANEPRPFVYRNLFQAYGTYIAPVGKGLAVDFGKWASALGPEGNYTKDQINYSRSYFFNYLPFYHMGVRANYSVNDRLSLGYWLVNGANQTEDFNGFKSQLVQVVSKPLRTVTWTAQYYNGREQADARPTTPRGTSHILDTYAFWTPNSKLTLGGELDAVISRVQTNSTPQRVTGGAAYFKYQVVPNAYFGQRYTRLNDSGALFSGVKQNLNDSTSTLGMRLQDNMEMRLEYRRDFSNRPYFLTADPNRVKTAQNTITVGLLWWLGGKQGGW